MLDAAQTSSDAGSLTLTWSTGETSCLSAETLRKQAQDAWSKRERYETGSVRVAPGLTITDVVDIGYGLNIHFSDGHDKAIYPAPFLRELSDGFDK